MKVFIKYYFDNRFTAKLLFLNTFASFNSSDEPDMKNNQVHFPEIQPRNSYIFSNKTNIVCCR